MKNWKVIMIVAVVALGLFSTVWYLYQKKQSQQSVLDEVAVKATPEEKFNRIVQIQKS